MAKVTPPPRIAIIGGGFCGVMVAAHLLRAPRPLEVVLINRPHATPTASGTLARGLAYGTDSPLHLLNVPAARMSAWPDAPDDFLAFLRQQGQAVGEGDFVPRAWYGRYLQHVFGHAMRDAASSITVIQDAVLDITISAHAKHTLQFGARPPLEADAVVLALGHFAPEPPSELPEEVRQSPRYVNDPWAEDALARVPIDRPVLAIGTGLTLYDVAQTLAAGAPEGAIRVTALSRRGLLPQAHRNALLHPQFSLAPMLAEAFESRPQIRAWLHALRKVVAAHEGAGGDWRDIMASLRPHTPALWHQLSDAERRRFLRHLKPYWESHRHRAAPETAQAMAGMIARGMLRIEAARVESVRSAGGAGFLVQYRQRSARQSMFLEVGSIINCTGPSSRAAAEPLLRAMMSRGLVQPDALSLGLQVAANYRLAPQHEAKIYYVGPLLRARDWEATAVPELREHAARCATEVLDQLLASRC
jgi:uncharacterized NAD(P)/FAD-binding protein YdhS